MKILIIHASAGQGHKRAAEAVFESLKQNTRHNIAIVDSLDYTNFLFKFLYVNGYAFLVTHFPAVWGFFYGLTDNPGNKLINSTFRFFNKNLNSLKLKNYLKKENPELIISTHFFANEIVSALKNENIISSKLVCIITDYLVHYYWIASGVDIYVVACQKAKEELGKFGVPEDKIRILGIPVGIKFTQQLDKVNICRRFNLSPHKFSVLVATGAFGFSSIGKIVNLLKDDVQLLVICGNNKKLFKKLSAYKTEGNLKVFGFVKNMHELMSVADMIVTKPGGLTITEALVKKLPMIFISAIPGQETKNAQFFQEQGIGFTIENISQIKEIITRFKNNKDYLGQVKAKMSGFSRPDSTKEILKLIE